MDNKVEAIVCSDIHLSNNPPIARSNEPDWYAAQARILKQLKRVSDNERVPIICAGDIFDRYNPPPSLINFAIENLPKMYAIPGQHDLPYHDYENLQKSAYKTLMMAGNITTSNEIGWPIGNLVLTGFPWNAKITPPIKTLKDKLSVAVVHKYIWAVGINYPGASKESNVSGFKKELARYNTAIFGDNHKSFSSVIGQCFTYNCGCLIKRHQDDRDTSNGVGLLMSNGSVKFHELDYSEDVWIDDPEEKTTAISPELEEFVTELMDMQTSNLDFREVVLNYILDNKVEAGVAKLIKELI